MIRPTLILGASLLAVPAGAQVIQAPSPFATPGESEAAKAAGAIAHKSSADAQALSQGEIDASPDGTKIGIQAADLWLNKWARFYGRVTVPVTQDHSKDIKDESTATATTESKAPVLSATAKQQLVDPYGGLANLSGGVFKLLYSFESAAPCNEKLQKSQKPQKASNVLPFATLVARQLPSRHLGAAADECAAERIASKAQGAHGIFGDLRAGFKFIELPDPGDSNPDVVGTKVNVFYSAAIGLKMIAPLYSSSDSNPNEPDLTHRTGGLTVGLYYVFNSAADTTQSSVYKDLLNKQTTAWTGVLGWDLPSTDVAALTFSITPKTSDSRLGKTFVFGLTLKNKHADESRPPDAGKP
jgi:hypothetical protein